MEYICLFSMGMCTGAILAMFVFALCSTSSAADRHIEKENHGKDRV